MPDSGVAEVAGLVERACRVGGQVMFGIACAVGSVWLGWLVPMVPLISWVEVAAVFLATMGLPLASVLVPSAVGLLRLPRREQEGAWQLAVVAVAGVALGVVGLHAGEQDVLAERGVWTAAVVVDKERTRSDYCTLRRSDGQEISPTLGESDGCDLASKGETLWVRYDPEGGAAPVTEVDTTPYRGVVTALVVLSVGMGTWRAVRESRRIRQPSETGNGASPGTSFAALRPGSRTSDPNK